MHNPHYADHSANDKRPWQQRDQSQDQDDESNGTPKRRLGKVDRGREACNECRRHKIRCHPHPDDPQHLFPCSRCERMNLGCEFSKHNRGRKRKRPLPLLGGVDAVEDQPQKNGGPSSAPSMHQHAKNNKNLIDSSPKQSFGDSRFPFITAEAENHTRLHHHDRSIKAEDDYRQPKQMSLRHMVGEPTSDEESSEDGDQLESSSLPRSNAAGEFHGIAGGDPRRKASNKGKAPTRGPELVDDPIRAGYVDEVEARALFHLFMTHHNTASPMLDPTIHTHDVVRAQSSFLYTSILCVASRYLSSLSRHTTDGPNMSPESAQSVHQQILVLAKDHMTWAYAEAISSIDVVRAMVILTLNKEPDDDKAGYHMNRAVLLAQELNLGRMPSVAEMSQMNEDDHKRVRMRQRVWFCVFIANSIFSMQFQQPMLIPQSDPLIASANHWLKRARPDTVLRDTQIVCSVELRRKYLKYRELLIGSIPNEPSYGSALALSTLTKTMNQDWDISCEAWIRDIIDVGGTSSNISKPRVWTAALRLNLNLLIVNQTLRLSPRDQIDQGSPSSIPAFNHCLNAASTVLLRFETLDRTQMTFATDTFLHFALYAATLLSTLCRGQHPYKFDGPEIEHCRRLITKVADALDAASAYPSDSPTLHAWYLRRLVQLLPPTSNTPAQTGPHLSISSSDLPLPSPQVNTQAPIDPSLLNVSTSMPVDPALTTVIGNEFDLFLGDFPWVGLGLDANFATSGQSMQDPSQNAQWNNNLMGMFGGVNGMAGQNVGTLNNIELHPTSYQSQTAPLEMPYGSGMAMNTGAGAGTAMNMGMGFVGGMGFSDPV
ncbi:uncharacterized protein I206_105145 [Kwoniella pini CBS 10737]|uniref:Zn(2)-C6 fungal-type domain-containing protein n=1 Tax=Kwoniella pini CBS 10737 TaxID=1296096 RepID=A0A1B9I533_9TREE|nr:uncharacterized protein I206_03945 [Kwoniella pini CBS 10737]OCF50620.1 hypothetical protein I206_03945 [Kwoniella pini CBS 10737]